MSYTKYVNPNSGSFMTEEPTAISADISVSASGVTNAVWVASGTYVTKVGVMASGLLVSASTTIDIGDGDDADRYIDGLVSLATNNIIFAPTIKLSTDITDRPTVRADEVHGHRYTGVDSIDVTVTNSKAAAGSIKVLVWHYI